MPEVFITKIIALLLAVEREGRNSRPCVTKNAPNSTIDGRLSSAILASLGNFWPCNIDEFPRLFLSGSRITAASRSEHIAIAAS